MTTRPAFVRRFSARRALATVTALAAVTLMAPLAGAALLKTDPAKPAAAKATVEIDVGSFDLGDPDYNKEVLKKEWFNAAQFPKATFVSTAIVPGTAGKFTVSGKLTIKGKTSDVSFPLTLKQEAGHQVFDGSLPIKRLTYVIGDGEWKDTAVVADEVVIKFHVVAS